MKLVGAARRTPRNRQAPGDPLRISDSVESLRPQPRSPTCSTWNRPATGAAFPHGPAQDFRHNGRAVPGDLLIFQPAMTSVPSSTPATFKAPWAGTRHSRGGRRSRKARDSLLCLASAPTSASTYLIVSRVSRSSVFLPWKPSAFPRPAPADGHPCASVLSARPVLTRLLLSSSGDCSEDTRGAADTSPACETHRPEKILYCLAVAPRHARTSSLTCSTWNRSGNGASLSRPDRQAQVGTL
jgi:hypothetical protein